MLHAGVEVGALLVADDHDGVAAEAPEAADDGVIFGIEAVAGQRRKVLHKGGDVVLKVRAVGMPRDLGLLPSRKLAVGLAQQAVDFALQLFHLVGDVDLAVVGKVPQFFDFAFEFSDRLLEVEEIMHDRLSITANRVWHAKG